MCLGTGERRNKGANDTHARFGLDAMPIMLIHRVEGPGLDLMHFTSVQLLDGSLALQAITGFEMVLLPERHPETFLKYAVRQCDAHVILGVEQAHAVPLVPMRLAFGSGHVFEGFYDHEKSFVLARRRLP